MGSSGVEEWAVSYFVNRGSSDPMHRALCILANNSALPRSQAPVDL